MRPFAEERRLESDNCTQADVDPSLYVPKERHLRIQGNTGLVLVPGSRNPSLAMHVPRGEIPRNASDDIIQRRKHRGAVVRMAKRSNGWIDRMKVRRDAGVPEA
jgi:hypothetical protein